MAAKTADARETARQEKNRWKVRAQAAEARIAELKAKNAALFDALITAELQSAIDRNIGEGLHEALTRIAFVTKYGTREHDWATDALRERTLEGKA